MGEVTLINPWVRPTTDRPAARHQRHTAKPHGCFCAQRSGRCPRMLPSITAAHLTLLSEHPHSCRTCDHLMPSFQKHMPGTPCSQTPFFAARQPHRKARCVEQTLANLAKHSATARANPLNTCHSVGPWPSEHLA
eukprot:352665-Chlamydomonas_euryale.AAC.1